MRSKAKHTCVCFKPAGWKISGGEAPPPAVLNVKSESLHAQHTLIHLCSIICCVYCVACASQLFSTSTSQKIKLRAALIEATVRVLGLWWDWFFVGALATRLSRVSKFDRCSS